ncbi:MAG: ATP synthase F0 subunit B [Acidobacteriia bacterium]|nr:ATP synthase F0 subunit B [Terriglobia bacterium]
MRKLAAVAVFAAGLLISASSTPLLAQPSAGEKETKAGGEAEGVSPLWAWANFAILASALGYLMVKKGGPWLAARSVAIRKGIAEAEEIREDAEARAAEVDRKLDGLDAEIAALRDHARHEQAAEAERIRQQTAADLARIQEHATSEIDAAGKSARLDLKRYAAQLAVDLAEQKIRRQLIPALQSVMVENFVRDLDRPSTGSHLNK